MDFEADGVVEAASDVGGEFAEVGDGLGHGVEEPGVGVGLGGGLGFGVCEVLEGLKAFGF